MVFDAVNAVYHFSPKSYYYAGSASLNGLTPNSASAAAVQAAHDVLIGTLPKAATWDATRAWLNKKLASDLTHLDVNASDPGIVAGQEAALAALKARSGDFSDTSAAT